MKPNYNPYKVLILTCWSMLIICFIIQLLGGDWFNVSTNNETLIKVCDYIDQRPTLEYLCICVVSLTLNSFTALAILGQKKFTNLQIVMYLPIMLLLTVASYIPTVLVIAVNLMFLIILPVVFNPTKWYRAFIGTGLIFVFQVLSMLIKNIGGIVLEDVPFLIGLILQIDSIIMVILYYLYSIPRKEVKT